MLDIQIDESPSQVGQRSVEEAEETADNWGLTAFFPLAHEVFLDDDSKAFTLEHPLLSTLEANGISLISSLRTVSKSRKRHWYLRLNVPVTDLQRVVIQLALGSDRTKELLTMLRLKLGGTGAIALFETADQAELVNNWRSQM